VQLVSFEYPIPQTSKPLSTHRVILL